MTDKTPAVKCNPDRMLLRLLADIGVNFDCASLAEIEQVSEMGVDPQRIIFAHPCKSQSALEIAARLGIRWTTFDNGDELDKIQRISPDMELLLRISVPDFGAKVPMGTKFGAHMEVTRPLLEKASLLGLKIIGVSFHIGPGSSDPNAFGTAVHYASCVFEESKELGFDMRILDVGGGFEDESFETMACTLRAAISRKFPSPIVVIAEPGRFYASGFYTMICKVIARRVHTGTGESKKPDMLYLNDGIYGCFSPCWAENAIFVPQLIELQAEHRLTPQKLEPHRYSIWGPTCCSIDCISKEVIMDQEVVIGDWLKFHDMGDIHYYGATITLKLKRDV
ncbi:ornithine decarboxylase protein [Rutstroemia sp. NJR-2017a WRK4]|nr:ornithine decarboxylase protein [Rutstroemia sp. NJR-2017a WRK4]